MQGRDNVTGLRGVKKQINRIRAELWSCLPFDKTVAFQDKLCHVMSDIMLTGFLPHYSLLFVIIIVIISITVMTLCFLKSERRLKVHKGSTINVD